jgi:hypothetical protein
MISVGGLMLATTRAQLGESIIYADIPMAPGSPARLAAEARLVSSMSDASTSTPQPPIILVPSTPAMTMNYSNYRDWERLDEDES